MEEKKQKKIKASAEAGGIGRVHLMTDWGLELRVPQQRQHAILV